MNDLKKHLFELAEDVVTDHLHPTTIRLTTLQNDTIKAFCDEVNRRYRENIDRSNRTQFRVKPVDGQPEKPWRNSIAAAIIDGIEAK